MNVYDFDKTIYDGDSSFDFYFHNLKRHWILALLWPIQAVAALRYKLKLIDKTSMKQTFYGYFKWIDDIDIEVELFWEKNQSKIKNFYASTHRDDDVIISASPEFMLKPICQKLNVTLIASVVDPKTGTYTGKNCFGEEKVPRFRTKFPDATIETFYSDSLSDTPLAKIANEAVLVTGDRLDPWPK